MKDDRDLRGRRAMEGRKRSEKEKKGGEGEGKSQNGKEGDVLILP